MKKKLLLASTLFLSANSYQPLAAQTLDLTFAPGTYYAPGTALSALEQADGKRVVLGSFSRATGIAASRLVRYTTTGTVDAAFQQNLNLTSQVSRITLLSNDQLLLTGYSTPLVAGGLTRNGLLRLNADGTGDAGFDPGTGPTSTTSSIISHVLPLPNGQYMVAGAFNYFNGVAANNLVRLNANGTVDATFTSSLALTESLDFITVQPNGKYLIGGYVRNAATGAFRGIARLNTDGTLDPTFTSPLSLNDDANELLVQPDGNIVVAGIIRLGGTTSYQALTRLLPNGSPDNSFVLPTSFTGSTLITPYGKGLEIQPDGKILVLTNTNNYAGLPNGVIRLNTNGTVDNTFQTGTGANTAPNSFTRLANGGLLIAGNFTNYNGSLDRPVVQLTSTGAVDPAFSPLLQVSGYVTDMVQQPDGKLIVSGGFSEVNGQSIRRVARLNTNGTLDTSFAPANDFDSPVGDLALQPDGRLLLIGNNLVQRLLPTGARDNSFVAPSFAGSNMYSLLLQPDGRVLVGGYTGYLNGVLMQPPLTRLFANGAVDYAYIPTSNGAGRILNLLDMKLQPNGKLLVAANFAPTSGSSSIRTVARLENNGILDASFATTSFTTSSTVLGINSLAVQPDGKVLVGGQFTAVGGTPQAALARLNANGTNDTGFLAPFYYNSVNTIQLQPNGRILAGGNLYGQGTPNHLVRLLPSGQVDSSYGTTAVPNNGLSSLLIQPDGKLVLSGGFTTIGGQAASGVARITGANVLPIRAPQAVADHTEAWPIPAHTNLTVTPDATAHPQTLDLLDLLGRTISHHVLNGNQPTTLAVSTLSPGTYLLRVSYTEGTVVQRVQVQ